MRPGVGLSPQMPQKCAGTRIEPPPSLPTPPADIPAAIAAASPPLEPPAVYSRFQGLFVRPWRRLSVSHAMRNSGVLVTPRTIAPALRSRATSGASCLPTIPVRRRVPASHGKPAHSIELLTLRGTPCNGPRLLSRITVFSAACASRSTRSASTCAKAFRTGFSRLIFLRCASASSTGEISLARTLRAISTAGRKVRSSMRRSRQVCGFDRAIDCRFLALCKMAPIAFREISQHERTDRYSQQPEHLDPESTQHSANLAVSALIEHHFEPTILLSKPQDTGTNGSQPLSVLKGNAFFESLCQPLAVG